MDTTRAIASLLYSGTLSRCPNIRFIVAHGGGMLPFIAARLARIPMRDKSNATELPNGPTYELKKLYFDLTSATSPEALACLRAFVPMSQFVFGTDFPYRKMSPTLAELDASPFSEEEKDALYGDNALRLLPRLASAWRTSLPATA